MLVIKDLPDLLKYLETRKERAKRQAEEVGSASKMFHSNNRGMIYAYEESIRAVKALMTYINEEEKE